MTFDINLLAVLVAAIAAMAIGAVWYSPAMFGRSWMRLIHASEEDMRRSKERGVNRLYIGQFIATLVTSYVLAHFIALAGALSAAEGIQVGFWAWLGFTAAVSVGDYLFSNRPQKLFVIQHGYTLVAMIVMGAILASWH